MALSRTIEYAPLDDLYLDPTNPRLGKENASVDLKQEKVLELMRGWALEELALSFLESGFWPQEAVIVVKEPLYSKPDKSVVIEGNRRIAALRYLRLALNGNPVSRSWKELAQGAKAPADLFTRIPYLVADSRSDVVAFLGFRHVTGIKEWNPLQKAEYIAHLVDDLKMSYEEILRKIGSRLDTVRRNYIAYRIFQQMGDLAEKVSLEQVEEKFSVLFLSLREKGVQQFLSIDIHAGPEDAKTPVKPEKMDDLADFAVWMFGTPDKKPLFSDSRYVGEFAHILASSTAVDYLRTSEEPSFDLAMQKSGIEEEDLERQILEATDHIEQALSRIHLHVASGNIQKAVRRFALGARELIDKFPEIDKEVFGGKGDRDA